MKFIQSGIGNLKDTYASSLEQVMTDVQAMMALQREELLSLSLTKNEEDKDRYKEIGLIHVQV